MKQIIKHITFSNDDCGWIEYHSPDFKYPIYLETYTGQIEWCDSPLTFNVRLLPPEDKNHLMEGVDWELNWELSL